MQLPELPDDPSLLKRVLIPLLDDFLFWYAHAEELLAGDRLPFLAPEEQDALLERVRTARAEVRSATALCDATGLGIDTAAVGSWHQLVVECWQVAARKRRETQAGEAAE